MKTVQINYSEIQDLNTLRKTLRSAKHEQEAQVVEKLLKSSPFSSSFRQEVTDIARKLVEESRAMRHERGTLDAFLQEFGLSNQEGIALMCLAEALLRIPDDETKDKLIAEKIASGNWADHLGNSDSLLVNASTWALMLTGRIVKMDIELQYNPDSWLKNLIARIGEPAIRKAMMQAMRIMGGEFVMGRTITEAIKRGGKTDGNRLFFSYDMLGEGARTYKDAQRYWESYANAIRTIGSYRKSDSPYDGPGISVKLSALHPKYDYAHSAKVLNELAPKLKALAIEAKQYNMGFTIDAEEADRLDISLDLIETLARDPELDNWNGLGLAVQAYQKRALPLINWLIALGRETGRRFMVRLVKGAYWDSEIKFTQIQNYRDYPVFTRKSFTDLCYIVCAQQMLEAPDAIYSQFATHNAHTLATILKLARTEHDYEFQRLHGMGQILFKAAAKVLGKPVHCRVYAPVGSHEDLLPYLVRRLLENGANSSFVNRFMNAKVSIDELIEDPISKVEKMNQKRHSNIPLPVDLYGSNRKNSRGLDLTDPDTVNHILEHIESIGQQLWNAAALVNGKTSEGTGEDILCPANNNKIFGHCLASNTADIEHALSVAVKAYPLWNKRGGEIRAQILMRVADKLEIHMERLMGIVVHEAGKTIPDALAEIREAVDFCRYYAEQAKLHFAEPKTLPGPTGELNQISLHGRGVFLCISPWNFPLAIFTGQIAAALAAGNTVIAKPAEQTPIIAFEAVKLFHEAGVPVEALHLLPGDGAKVGATLVADERIAGVAFTGSTETAKAINLSLAKRKGAIVPLIAETGGQNAMIVDSTALLEQVTDDVIKSSFLSAGQRCSALRVLFVQHEIADKLIEMLSGALDTLKVGDPQKLSTDIGPIIDFEARKTLQAHAERMSSEAKLIKRYELDDACKYGSFFGPHIFELSSLEQLEREVFGPILHIIRYDDENLENVVHDIVNTGYGLTLGIHSRIANRAEVLFANTCAGNTYVNRDMVGAVVGVQPFGGQGLSGTGPKAGGPHYLFRFATERTYTENTVATGGNAALFCLGEE